MSHLLTFEEGVLVLPKNVSYSALILVLKFHFNQNTWLFFVGTGSKNWAATPVSMNTWPCSLSLHRENYLRIMDPERSYQLITSDLSKKICLSSGKGERNFSVRLLEHPKHFLNHRENYKHGVVFFQSTSEFKGQNLK